MEIRKVQPGVVWVLSKDLSMTRYVDELAEELGVTPQTIRRWYRGERITPMAQLALRFLLGEINHPNWKDAHVSERDGKLWMSNGFGFQPGELEYVSLVYQTNRSLWRSVSPERHTTMAGAQPARQVTQRGDSGDRALASL